MDNNKFIELVIKHLTGEMSKEDSTELKKIINNDEACKEQHDALCMYWTHTDIEYTDDATSFRKIQDKISGLKDDSGDTKL